MKQFFKPLLAILLSFTMNASIAQSFNLKFTNITTKQGLLSNTIWEIEQDNSGYLWILQEGGISRYDGINFKDYNSFVGDSTNDKIVSSFNLFIDRSGQIWVFENSGMFLKYNRRKDVFVLYDYFDHQEIPEPVSHFFESKNGILWYADRDLLFNDTINKRFVTYEFKHKALDSLTITSVCEDNYNNLWVSTSEGIICKIETQTGEEIIYKSDQWPDNVNKLYFDSKDTMWLLSNQSIGIIDLDSMRYESKYNGFLFNEFCNVLEDNESNLWFATEGLLYYNRKDDEFHSYTHDKNDFTSISSNIIQALHIDSNGGFWVGNDIEGIDYCKLNDCKSFKHYQRISGNTNSLVCDTITAFAGSTNSNMWIGTYKGLDKFNLSANTYEHYLQGECIFNVHEDGSGNLWVIIASTGNEIKNSLLLRKSGSGIFQNVEISPDIKTDLFIPISIFETSQNRILIGGKKLFIYNEKINALEPIVNDIEILEDATMENDDLFITSMAEDAYGNIAVLVSNYHNNSQLFILKKDSQRIIPCNIDGLGAWRFAYENQDRIWLIGGNNLAHLDSLDALNSCNPKPIDLSPLSQIRNAFSLIRDDKDNLWCGTDNGLYRFNLQTSHFLYFNFENGMPHRYIGYSTDYIRDYFPSINTADDEILMGTPNGFIRFDPEAFKPNLTPPTVEIIDFKIFSKSVPVRRSSNQGFYIENSISSTKHITISYRERDFSFEFIALDLTSPLSNKYAYMMEGYDQDWEYTDGSNRIAKYSNVPGGDYTFRVKASNSHGVWNETGTALEITIKPPIWKTKWFILLSSIILISLVFDCLP